MALKRIKYCPAQHPILPWWEDAAGNEVKNGQEHFRAEYAGQKIIVLQLWGMAVSFMDDLTCKPVEVYRADDGNIWVEVEDDSSQ